jgi:hypothetical protein
MGRAHDRTPLAKWWYISHARYGAISPLSMIAAGLQLILGKSYKLTRSMQTVHCTPVAPGRIFSILFRL